MEDITYVPNSTQGGDAPPGNLRELSPLAEFLYSMFEAENNVEQNTFTLKLRFFQLNQQELEEKIEAVVVEEEEERGHPEQPPRDHHPPAWSPQVHQPLASESAPRALLLPLFLPPLDYLGNPVNH